jgi:hypothetical protein
MKKYITLFLFFGFLANGICGYANSARYIAYNPLNQNFQIQIQPVQYIYSIPKSKPITPVPFEHIKEYWQNDADKGGAYGCLRMGELYLYGNNGVEQNFAKAIEYLTISATLGDTDAKELLIIAQNSLLNLRVVLEKQSKIKETEDLNRKTEELNRISNELELAKINAAKEIELAKTSAEIEISKQKIENEQSISNAISTLEIAKIKSSKEIEHDKVIQSHWLDVAHLLFWAVIISVTLIVMTIIVCITFRWVIGGSLIFMLLNIIKKKF